MKSTIRKRGQRFLRRFSRVSIKASEEGKEHIKENFIERFSHIANIKLLILEWGLLVVALVMLAITQAFWFGGSYAVDVFSEGGVYTEATIGNVNSLNPLFATTSSERVLSRLLFSTLSTVDYSGHAGIGLAESITMNEDGKVWTVKLRDNLKWSDGEPITNEDVIFTANIIKNPSVNTVYDSNLTKVEVTEDEEGNILFTLPSTYADFITALDFPIIPKHVLEDADPKTLIENNFSNSPVTSGAFMLNAVQSSSESEKVFYLSANPNYYKGKVLLNTFAVHTFLTKEEVIKSVNANAVTATAELTGAEADQITTGQFNLKNSSLSSGAFIFFNTKSENVKNVALRQAIREGINLENIRAAAPETIALNYPLLKSQINLSSYPEIPASDFEKAKATIQELTGEGEQITLNVATVNAGYLPKVAEVLKNELEELGIDAVLTIYEENQEFISNIISKRSYDVLIYEIELGTDPDLLPYYHSSQASEVGLNLSNYRNSLVDDLILGARDATDQGLRTKKYETFLEYWVNDVPAIALYQPNLTYYYNKNVRTFNDVTIVTALDRFTDINDWAVSKETKNKTP